MSSLPKGWIETTLEDACEKISDGTHHSPKEQYDERESADGVGAGHGIDRQVLGLTFSRVRGALSCEVKRTMIVSKGRTST